MTSTNRDKGWVTRCNAKVVPRPCTVKEEFKTTVGILKGTFIKGFIKEKRKSRIRQEIKERKHQG